jgi:thiamine-monophosphate kinase
LKVLVNGLQASEGIREVLVDSVLMPHARLEEGLALSQTGAVTASIDSSDGLAWSLHEIAKASNVGFLINNLPISKEAAKFAQISKLDPVELTLYGGEEYELVLTIKPHSWNRAKKVVEDTGGKLLRIGKTIPEKKLVLEVKGKRTAIEPRGWEHFSMR